MSKRDKKKHVYVYCVYFSMKIFLFSFSDGNPIQECQQYLNK